MSPDELQVIYAKAVEQQVRLTPAEWAALRVAVARVNRENRDAALADALRLRQQDDTPVIPFGPISSLFTRDDFVFLRSIHITPE